jgi:hypothetical protein
VGVLDAQETPGGAARQSSGFRAAASSCGAGLGHRGAVTLYIHAVPKLSEAWQEWMGRVSGVLVRGIWCQG